MLREQLTRHRPTNALTISQKYLHDNHDSSKQVGKNRQQATASDDDSSSHNKQTVYRSTGSQMFLHCRKI
jgi:hypothetical protein